MSRQARTVNWQDGPEPRVPYVASVDGERWELQRGEDMTVPRYTLVVDGVVVEELSEWPSAWVRPPGDDPYQRREMELEEEKFERSLKIKPSKLV
jgi:hypothetical protein